MNTIIRKKIYLEKIIFIYNDDFKFHIKMMILNFVYNKYSLNIILLQLIIIIDNLQWL